jgi:hypothetical protein
VDTLHVRIDSLRFNSTEFEPPPKDSRAPIAERSEISPVIPETPAVAPKNMRCEEDDHSDGNTLSFILTLVDRD